MVVVVGVRRRECAYKAHACMYVCVHVWEICCAWYVKCMRDHAQGLVICMYVRSQNEFSMACSVGDFGLSFP